MRENTRWPEPCICRVLYHRHKALYTTVAALERMWSTHLQCVTHLPPITFSNRTQSAEPGLQILLFMSKNICSLFKSKCVCFHLHYANIPLQICKYSRISSKLQKIISTFSSIFSFAFAYISIKVKAMKIQIAFTENNNIKKAVELLRNLGVFTSTWLSSQQDLSTRGRGRVWSASSTTGSQLFRLVCSSPQLASHEPTRFQMLGFGSCAAPSPNEVTYCTSS